MNSKLLWLVVVMLPLVLHAQQTSNGESTPTDMVNAHTPNAELMQAFRADASRVGGNMHSYEFLPIQDTPAPKGYVPFYISHYGRHGSRSAWSDEAYQHVRTLLMQADSLGVLTPAGRALWAIADSAIACYDGMAGRLTDRGEREHALLAERMYKRFEPVFKVKSPQVRSIGSMVQRCLISMAAFTNSLTRQNTHIQYNFDTGTNFQKYLLCTGKDDDVKAIHDRTRDSLIALIPNDTIGVLQRLFTDTAHLSIGSIYALQKDIYDLAAVAQDFDLHCNIFDYMDTTAVYYMDMRKTLYIALYFCNIEGIGALRVPHAQVMLDDVIAKAEENMAGGPYVADLRFGHDFPLLCIVNRMHISGVGDPLRADEVEQRWMTYRNICMASNLQIVFYRSKKQPDILVKVLYNEQERYIRGIEPVQGCYYRWQDVKTLWQHQ